MAAVSAVRLWHSAGRADIGHSLRHLRMATLLQKMDVRLFLRGGEKVDPVLRALSSCFSLSPSLPFFGNRITWAHNFNFPRV